MDEMINIKCRPLGIRIVSVFAAIVMCLSFMRVFPAGAYSSASKDITEPYDMDESVSDDEMIITGEAEAAEVMASYIPMTEEESQAVFEELVLNANNKINILGNGSSGFQSSFDEETIQDALKTFKLEYAFPASASREGDTSHSIERSESFLIKGRLTINTDYAVQPGKMEVRIPERIFSDRNGNYIKIKTIGVSKFRSVPEKNDDGSYNVAGIFTESVVPYNYFIDSSTGEYVIVNYSELDSSSNSIEISFDKAEIFDITDDTQWDIKPVINIIYDMEDAGTIPVISGTGLGGAEDIYTRCMYNSGSGTIELYRRNIETGENNARYYTYYDLSGRPYFVYDIRNNKWYTITIPENAINVVYKAEYLKNNFGTETDSEPDIEVCIKSLKIENREGAGLAGSIDSGVTLDSVAKTATPNNSSGYGSQLYTKGQMSKYINTSNLDPRVLTGNNLSEDYIYTCWKVTTSGKCTQPWSMLFKERPKVAQLDSSNQPVTDDSGQIVYNYVDDAIILGVSTVRSNNGFFYASEIKSDSDSIKRLYQYVSKETLAGDDADYQKLWYVADSNAEMRSQCGLSYVAEDYKYNMDHYVVIAYPKDSIPKYYDDNGELKYAEFSNDIDVLIYPRDDNVKIEKDTVTQSPIVFKNFKWEGGTTGWRTYKRADEEGKEGLISVMDTLAGKGVSSGVGNITFAESYRGGAYMECHKNSGDYGYVKGKYYTITNADDILTAQPYGEVRVGNEFKRFYGKPALLDGSDYFYSYAELRVSEFDIDPFEDNMYSLNSASVSEKITDDDSVDRDWKVYGWYEGGTDWELIDLTRYGFEHPTLTVEDYVRLKDKNSFVYIRMDFLDKGERCPYRIKSVHNTTAYDTRANLTLTTQLKVDSPKFNKNTGCLRKGFFYEDGTPLDESNLEPDTFRISLRNYSANTCTAYDANEPGYKKEIIDIFSDGNGKYVNYEVDPYYSSVNANRYDFVDMSKLYSSMSTSSDRDSYWHVNKEERIKSELGSKLLANNANMPSQFGESEYLPMQYIIGDTTTYTSREEFLEKNRHILRDEAAIDITALEPAANANKYASWENDTQKGQVIMTYTLTGYEGYRINKDFLDILDADSYEPPEREYVYICDLLPAGVNYYGYEQPTIGKLSTIKVGKTDQTLTSEDVDEFVSSWDRGSDTIELVETETFTNWKNTGRTLIRFKLHIKNTEAVSNDGNCFIGCGIRFKAYVLWENYSSASEKDNIFAYVAADDNNGGDIIGRWTGKADSQVYDDAGSVVPVKVSTMDYTSFENVADFDEDGDSNERNRMYGHANEMASITMARTLGIKESVKADADTYADYTEKTSVAEHQDYTYKIHIDKTEQGAAGNIVVFDRLEAVYPGNWKGTFKEVDITEILNNFQLERDDVTIWYSKSDKAPIELYKVGDTYTLNGSAEGAEFAEWSFTEANKLVSDDKKWHVLSESVDSSEIQSIAVDFGNKLVLDKQAVINIYVRMEAPAFSQTMTHTFDRSSFYFQDFQKNGDTYEPVANSFSYSESNIATVTLGKNQHLRVKKNMPENMDISSDIIQNSEFTFKLVSRQESVDKNIKPDEDAIEDNDIQVKDVSYANIAYRLYDNDNHEIEAGSVHATNEDGEFKLKFGQTAVFDIITSSVNAQDEIYDFDNIKVIEKSFPYWLGVKNVESDASEAIITVTNYFRPTLYITKTTKGVPETASPENMFSFRLKIFDKVEDKWLSYSDLTNGGYSLLNKGVSDQYLYTYKADAAAGLYELPKGWDIENEQENIYESYSVNEDTDGTAYYDITLDTGITKTLALPVYIKHIVNENDTGMFMENNGVYEPRYSFTIEELPDANGEWYCEKPVWNGEIGSEENSHVWTNRYRYKELMLKKTVSHAPDDLEDYAFTFQLTDSDGVPYYQYADGKQVKWQLCKTDSSGEAVPVTGDGKSGEVDNNGVFTVKGCGNPSGSSGEQFVIRLSYAALESDGSARSYIINEILDKETLQSLGVDTSQTSTTDDLKAVKGKASVTVRTNSLQAEINVENDYLKRSITIRKTVASDTIPDQSKKFTMILCPENGAYEIPEYTISDKNGDPVNATVTNVDIPETGWLFELADSWSITFRYAGNAGDYFKLYEKIDSSFEPLSLTYDENEVYTDPQRFILPSSEDYSTNVVNGKDGYIVIRKQYKGDYLQVDDELKNDTDNRVKLRLELKSGKEYKTVSGLSNGIVTAIGGDANRSFSDTGNIAISSGETLIVDLAELTRLLTGSSSPLCSYRITETSWTKQIGKDGSWYVIEPEAENAVWEYTNEDKLGTIVNNVTCFSSENVIYKRIGFKDKSPEKPTGIISFTVRDQNGEPVQGVRCIAARQDSGSEVLTEYKCVSDAKGIIDIDFSRSEINNEGWKLNAGVTQYYLKLFFDRAVKISPQTPGVLSITENTSSTDKSWGVPAGYEKCGVEDTYVNETHLREINWDQWCSDADTFVNSQDTELFAVTKTVHPSGETLTDEDKDTYFTFVISERIGNNYFPAPHISYSVYSIDDEELTNVLRTGITDADENDSNSGWGVFRLRHGEKAVLDLPKNAYWQITEDNTGSYKLASDTDGNIIHDSIEGNNDNILDNGEATAVNETARDAYSTREIAQGFEMHSTFDMLSSFPRGGGVVLINGSADKNSPMFAWYDETQDSLDMDDSGVYTVPRTTKLKEGQTSESNYYYLASDISTDKYNNSEFTIKQEIYDSYECTADDLIWSSETGVTDKYYPNKNGTINIPEYVWIKGSNGNAEQNKIVGIGKNAYSGIQGNDSVMNTVVVPQYVEKVGDRAFYGCTYLKDVVWQGNGTENGVKVLGSCSFSNTSVDVVIPDTAVTLEHSVFKDYSGQKYGLNKKTYRNSPDSPPFRLEIPESVRYFASVSPTNLNLNQTLGQGQGEYYKITGNSTNACYHPLRLGSGDSIEELKTGFTVIGGNNDTNKNKVGIYPVNACYGSAMVWACITFGGNDEGLTIMSDLAGQLRNISDSGTYGELIGRIMVLPKGNVTLKSNCFDTRNNLAQNHLLVFQTDDISELTIEGNISSAGTTPTIIVFTNLDSSIENNTEWQTKLSRIKSNRPCTVYYRDQLRNTNNNELVTGIINSIGLPDGFWDQGVKDMLYRAAGVDDVPLPNGLPAARNITRNVIPYNTVYIERKKELLSS